MAKVTAPKRLTHLYTVKTDPIPFQITDDESGEVTEIKVVVVKPNRNTMEVIERRAAAARARFNLKLDDPDSDESMSIEDDVLLAESGELVAAIVTMELRKKQIAIYYEHRAEEKWAKDDYLIGLETAWVGEKGVPSPEFIYATGYEPLDDPDEDEKALAAYSEAKAIYEKLAEFNREVTELIDVERDAMVNDLAGLPRPKLEEQAREALKAISAESAYQEAVSLQRLFHCTRQAEDLSARYFGSIGEVEASDDVVKDRLNTEYMLMEVPALEGKDLPGKPGSSPTTEPTETDPSTSSGPEDAAA